MADAKAATVRTAPLTARQLEKLARYQAQQAALQAEINVYMTGIADGCDPPAAPGAGLTIRDGQLVITES